MPPLNLGKNLALLGGGLAAGAFVGNAIVRASSDEPKALGLSIGGGIGLGVAGGIGAKLAFGNLHHAVGAARYGASALGIGVAAFGIGAAISGAITGALHEPAGSKPTGPDKPPTWPTDPTVPGNPTTPSPSRDVAGALRSLQSNAWMKANTTADDRTLLAAGASSAGVGGPAAAGVMQELSADEWVGANYSSFDRAEVAVAALESKRTGAEAATTLVNVDGALDTSGAPATVDIENPSDRAELAEAAIRGGATGEDAAFMYAGIRNSDSTNIDAHSAVRLASAALESRSSLDNATAAFRDVSSNAATKALPLDQRIALAGGALQGGTTGGQAASNYAAFAGDEFISQILASGDLTTDHATRIVAATTAERLTGQDAALTLSNAVADENVYTSAETYEQLVGMTVGALQGQHTGEEAAAAFNAVSSGQSTRGLDADTRFLLAGGALAGNRPVAETIAAYQRVSTDASVTAETSAVQDALLATTATGGFDASSDSELARWFSPAGA